jgi:glycerophosphoryl diester phosphodiesterase
MWIGINKWAQRLKERYKTRRALFQTRDNPLHQQQAIQTQIFAHRGSKANRPENTLAAFAEAVRVGVDGIELDVHLTRDDQLLVIHDETIDRTTTGTGLVRQLSLAEIRQYSAGAWFDPSYAAEKVPRLSDVLTLLTDMDFAGVLNIEIKTDKYAYPGIEQKTSDLLTAQAHPFSHLYSSFNLDSLKRLSELEPDVDLCLILSTSEQQISLGLATDFITHLHPRFDWVKKNAHRLQELGKPIRPWTVNNDADLAFAFRQQLAGLITDYPELALQVKRHSQTKSH